MVVLFAKLCADTANHRMIHFEGMISLSRKLFPQNPGEQTLPTVSVIQPPHLGWREGPAGIPSGLQTPPWSWVGPYSPALEVTQGTSRGDALGPSPSPRGHSIFIPLSRLGAGAGGLVESKTLSLPPGS